MIGLIARPYAMTYVNNGSGFDANFPPSNLTNNDYGRVTRITQGGSASGVRYVFDLGQVRSVDVLALLWHNLGSNGDDRIRFVGTNNPDGFSNPIYDSGYVLPRTGTTARETLQLWKTVLTLPADYAARYWSIEYSLPANRTTQASRFFVGKGAKFAIGPQKASLGAKDMNANVTTEVGETRSQEDPSLIRPVVSLSFEYGKQSEMEQVLGQYTLSLGVSKPMLICTDLTSPYIQDNTAFGRPEKVVQLDSAVYDVWSFEAVVPSLGV
jgi:hypothetical protein